MEMHFSAVHESAIAITGNIFRWYSGQGTGLGLSLSYDIVKAHGGELKVFSAEGESSEFVIEVTG